MEGLEGAVMDRFVDPGSAKFEYRTLLLYSQPLRPGRKDGADRTYALCGAVREKNQMVGLERFVSIATTNSGGSVSIHPAILEFGDLSGGDFNAFWNRMCQGKTE